MIDTLALARDSFPGKRNNLDALCERFGVSNAHRTLHGALLDAQLLAEVYLAMTRGQETLTIDIGDAPGSVVAGDRRHRRGHGRRWSSSCRPKRSSRRTRTISRRSTGNRAGRCVWLAASGTGKPAAAVTTL